MPCACAAAAARAAKLSAGGSSAAAIGRRHQITLARIRSFVLSAPTSAAGVVDDQHAGDAVLLHQLGRLDRERVGAHELRPACMTSRACRARRSAPRLDEPAQVAVGEDAEHPAVGVGDGGEAQALAGHLAQHVGESACRARRAAPRRRCA